MKVSLDSLDEEIKKELENFNAEVINAARRKRKTRKSRYRRGQQPGRA